MSRLILAVFGFALIPAVSVAATLHVPSDPKAAYTILARDTSGNERTITTKRVGSSGTSYSRRLYNCADRTVKYLGSGETLEQMKASQPDPRMGPIVSGSIADYVGAEACR
ncbi:hypothetical protein OZ911_08365 [Pseudomonas fortuita]|jgi:hypothetical protein|uniref:Uncharacterized protein n=1 Tax=Pseudomonas fortuita TaxID=3233375 RepID=A0ACD4PBK1_9PSED|nr:MULTISPECIES: hypothetical protein [Pseudomonas]WAP65398.1 hypothetical protein OZ911_08365 [Pseudomonas putida]